MRDRQIIDYLGRDTGATMARITWRSKPTQSPLTGEAVRCVVVQDSNGQYWAGHRAGSREKVGQYEFWSEPLRDRGEALSVSRNSTRDFLACHAELYSEQVKGKRPGKEIVRVTMDDGWSVAIRAPEKRPSQTKIEAFLEHFGKGRPSMERNIELRRRHGPSR